MAPPPVKQAPGPSGCREAPRAAPSPGGATPRTPGRDCGPRVSRGVSAARSGAGARGVTSQDRDAQGTRGKRARAALPRAELGDPGAGAAALARLTVADMAAPARPADRSRSQCRPPSHPAASAPASGTSLPGRDADTALGGWAQIATSAQAHRAPPPPPRFPWRGGAGHGPGKQAARERAGLPWGQEGDKAAAT